MRRKRYGRYRRYRSRNDLDFVGGVFGLIFLYVGLQALNVTSRGDIDVTNVTSTLLPFVLVAATLLFIIFLGTKYLKKIINKLKRLWLYQYYRSLDEIREMHPRKAEEFVAAVYEKQGYAVVKVTQYVGDHGIDGILSRDGKRYAVQVKRYSSRVPVGEPEVRDFYGSYVTDGFHGGFFVTTSHFTLAARKWAEGRNIQLVDGRDLVKMIRTYDRN